MRSRQVSGSLCEMEEFPKGVAGILVGPRHEGMILEIAANLHLAGCLGGSVG